MSIDAVAKNCPMTAATLETGGAGKREPEWQMDIYLAAHTSDPVDAARRLSMGHAEYDYEKTLEKLAQKRNAITAGNLGWPECAKFHHAACQTCPLRVHGKSPFHFAQPDVPPVQPTEEDDEIMPQYYFRNKDKHVIAQLADGRYFTALATPCSTPSSTGKPMSRSSNTYPQARSSSEPSVWPSRRTSGSPRLGPRRRATRCSSIQNHCRGL